MVGLLRLADWFFRIVLLDRIAVGVIYSGRTFKNVFRRHWVSKILDIKSLGTIRYEGLCTVFGCLQYSRFW